MCFLSLHGVRVGLVVYDADKDPLLIYLGSNPLSGIHFKIIFYCFIVFLTYENIGLDIGIEYLTRKHSHFLQTFGKIFSKLSFFFSNRLIFLDFSNIKLKKYSY